MKNSSRLEIVPITLKEANAYVDQHHRHHGPVVCHKFSIGCSNGEDIVVYRGNYGNCPVFVRHLRNFNDFVERNGYRGQRFQEIKY